MSHIDSFEHALVGYLFGVPVYLSLEEIDGDFCCSSRTLVIGGGSGEHPAMVLADPEGAVARYVASELPVLRLRPGEKSQWEAACLSHLEKPAAEVLRHFGWSKDDHAEFRRRCSCDSTPNPYSIYDPEISFEDWLILGLGEFVFYAMPDLAADLIGRLGEPRRHFKHLRYSNILLAPPNVPVYANGGTAFEITLRR